MRLALLPLGILLACAPAIQSPGTEPVVTDRLYFGRNIGDTLGVTYDGSSVRYLRNGVVLNQQAAVIAQPLYLDSSFLRAGNQISDLKFKKYDAPEVGSVRVMSVT